MSIKKNWGIYVIITFLVLSLIYIIIKQESLIIQVHDLLDNHINIFSLMSQNELFWSVDGKIPVLGGLTRNVGYYDLKVYNILFFFFPPFIAMIVGWYLKILISIVGFKYFLKEVDKTIDDNLALIIGLLYGVLPVYPTQGLGFASIPLIIFFIIKVYKDYSFKYLIALSILPIFSDSTLFGLYICGYLFLFFIVDWLITRNIKIHLLWALCSIMFGYIVTEWRLIYYIVSQRGNTIREDFNQNYISLVDSVKESINAFIHGQYHCGDLHTYVVLPICLTYILWLLIKSIKYRKASIVLRNMVFWGLCLIIVNCIVYGFDNNVVFRNIVGVIPLLGGYSFARTLWLNPYLWMYMFAIVVSKIRKPMLQKTILGFAFAIVFIVPSVYNHINMNIVSDVRYLASGVKTDTLSYEEFYSSELFDEIKHDIHYNNEWCVSYGMHPAVIQYNNFHTLDGYNSFYPMEYKKRFREIIAPELDIDENHRTYYDDWGARAYIFSNEIGYDPDRYFPESATIRIDVNAFKELGGKYIISRVDISNANEAGIHFVGKYTDEMSPYIIYVYSVN